MSATPRVPRVPRDERTGLLLDAALGLIAERGYRAVSVQAIADAAGVTKPILYRSFPSLGALLLALFRREQRRAEEMLEQVVPKQPGDRHPVDLLMDSLGGILESASCYPQTWRLILFAPEGTPTPVRLLVDRRRAGVVRRARRLVAWGAGYLGTDEDLDEDVLARMLVSAAQEHARILLEDETTDADALLASTRALLGAVAWREGD